jgi:hypothetical protein
MIFLFQAGPHPTSKSNPPRIPFNKSLNTPRVAINQPIKNKTTKLLKKKSYNKIFIQNE